MFANKDCTGKFWILLPWICLQLFIIVDMVLYTITCFTFISAVWGRILYWIFFYIFFLLFQAHYIRCVFSDPGEISVKWSEENLERVAFRTPGERERFLTEYPSLRPHYESPDDLHKRIYNYCFDCKRVKPQRCHHCSVCNRCFLRMDHHCPWIGNCVGQNTHKFFLMFLFLGFVLSAIATGTILPQLIKQLSIKTTLNSDINLYCLLLSLVFMISFAFSALIMGIIHLNVACNNYTTVEQRVYESYVFNSYQYCQSPYSLGSCKKNIFSFMGKGVCSWLLPTLPDLDNDGHYYKIDSEKQLEVEKVLISNEEEKDYTKLEQSLKSQNNNYFYCRFTLLCL